MKFPKHQETGRSCVGDGATLVEFHSTGGGMANAVIFDSASSLLFEAIASAYDFLTFPMVHGLCELIDTNQEGNAVLYKTGEVRTIAELLTISARGKKKVSRKAVAELCLLTGLILMESSENGEPMGVVAHGDLRPERIVVSVDGELSVIGYGLPNPAVVSWRQNEGPNPTPKLLTYAPPERFDETPEDARSDLYSLALVAAEVILGTPILTGSFKEIQTAVQTGLPTKTIAQKKKQIGAPFAELLCAALATDIEDRISPEDFVATARQLVEGVQGGDSLATACMPLFSGRKGKAIKSAKAAQATEKKPKTVATKPVEEERFSAPEAKTAPKIQKPKEKIDLKEAPSRPTRKDDSTGDNKELKRPKRKSPPNPEEDRPKRNSAPEEKPKRKRAAAKEAAPEEKPKRKRAAVKEAAPEEKPKRKRAAAKEAAPEEKPKRKRAAATEAAPEEKPKRRRVTAAPAEDIDDAPPRRRRRAVSQETEEEEPQTPRRRRRS